MTLDGLNALQLEYNFLNLTGEVSDSSGDPLATYTWLADGTKVGVVDDDGHGLEYTGSLIYKRNGTSLELESTSFGGGRIEVSEGTSGNVYTPNYFLTDHLGSTRAVVTPNGTVRERNDYHPFGLRWSNANTQVSDNRFRFSGKEEQALFDLPYQDFGARFFGGKLPIFTTPDPRATDYYPISLYAYVANNPVKHTDPNGKWIVGTDGKKVTYSPDKGWSKNASPDVQRIGNAMLKINIGTERLNFMLNTDEKVSLSISPDVMYGETPSPFIGGRDSKRVRISSPIVTEHNITIFEGSINEAFAKWGYMFDAEIDKENTIGVIGVHESGHVNKENTQLKYDSNNNLLEMTDELKNEIEAFPRELERQAVKEYKELFKKDNHEN
jgi:RHS repeat-associated protein